jgi:uncharacterized protein Yka (UPF0111/DUF47 family)
MLACYFSYLFNATGKKSVSMNAICTVSRTENCRSNIRVNMPESFFLPIFRTLFTLQPPT